MCDSIIDSLIVSLVVGSALFTDETSWFICSRAPRSPTTTTSGLMGSGSSGSKPGRVWSQHSRIQLHRFFLLCISLTDLSVYSPPPLFVGACFQLQPLTSTFSQTVKEHPPSRPSTRPLLLFLPFFSAAQNLLLTFSSPLKLNRSSEDSNTAVTVRGTQTPHVSSLCFPGLCGRFTYHSHFVKKIITKMRIEF